MLIEKLITWQFFQTLFGEALQVSRQHLKKIPIPQCKYFPSFIFCCSSRAVDLKEVDDELLLLVRCKRIRAKGIHDDYADCDNVYVRWQSKNIEVFYKLIHREVEYGSLRSEIAYAEAQINEKMICSEQIFDFVRQIGMKMVPDHAANANENEVYDGLHTRETQILNSLEMVNTI